MELQSEDDDDDSAAADEPADKKGADAKGKDQGKVQGKDKK